MIPKDVLVSLGELHNYAFVPNWDDRNILAGQHVKVIQDFLDTTDRYIKDLEQHVDDLVASGHGG